MSLSYQLTFLLRANSYKKNFLLRKQLTTTVFLRSPKHFNIAKHKITNLNFKNINFKIYPKNIVSTQFLLLSSSLLFNSLCKPISLSPSILPNSIKINLATKFRLIWLEF